MHTRRQQGPAWPEPIGQSSAGPFSCVPHSGTRQITTAMAASAIGTLTKNTQRHEACCTNQPPATGPTAVVMALKPDQVPMARPRSSGENEVLINAEAVRNEQRGADALNSASHNELCNASGKSAGH